MVHPGDKYNLCLQYLSTTYLFWNALVRWFDFSSAHGAVPPQISADMSKFIFYIQFLTKAFVLRSTITIPKTSIAPEIDLPKRKGSSSNHPFLGAKVRCGECIWSLRYIYSTTRWWQLKYLENVSPLKLGKSMIQFDGLAYFSAGLVKFNHQLAMEAYVHPIDPK